MLGMMPQKKKIASVILDAGGVQSAAPEVESDSDPGMQAVAEKFMSAIEKKDSKLLASALRDAFMILESEEEMGENIGNAG